MTVEQWLAARRPAPPAVLAERVRELLARHGDPGATEVAEACLAAGEAIVARLLGDGCTSRDSALDLLAADALVTYAFEAAADRPDSLGERAHQAMVRISGLADVGA